MLPVNNLIFDSTSAADGAWRNVSNFVSISIQISGAEGHVWVEATNNPDLTQAGVNVSGNLPSSPSGTDEIAIIVSGTNVLWSPSCLVWNWVRVRKDATAETLETKAFLFGQNG